MKQITNPDNNMWRSADPPQRTERVAARIGGGGLNAIDQEHGLSDKSGSVFQQSLEQINDRILEKNDIECIANGLSSNDKLTIDMNEVPERLQAKLRVNYSEFRHTIADAQSIHHNEPDVYFYHSDHLGSASWITDNGGLAVQHLQYLPYGERYVDQRTAGYHERFTFTGKERDEETGYGYFGARYMDHELMTMWLSVDPMADKYPSISPYAYCAWNPIKLIDPDGRDTIFSFARHTKNEEYNEKNNNLLRYLRNIGDNKALIAVGMHGSKDEASVDICNTVSGSSTTPISAKEFADKLRSGFCGSTLYTDNLEKHKQTIIVMYSCYTGRGDNSFGQQLSDELQSAIVIAPVGAVWAGMKQGKTTIENCEAIPDKTHKNKYIKGSRCSWGIFYRGEKIMSFSYPAPQSWIKRQGGINKVIEKVMQQYEKNS